MSEAKSYNKAARIREILKDNPKISVREMSEMFAKEGQKLAAPQFFAEKKKLIEAGIIEATAKAKSAKPKMKRKTTTNSVAANQTAASETPAMLATATATAAKASSTSTADAKQMLTARRAIRQAVIDAVARVGSFQAVDFLYEDIKQDLIG